MTEVVLASATSASSDSASRTVHQVLASTTSDSVVDLRIDLLTSPVGPTLAFPSAFEVLAFTFLLVKVVPNTEALSKAFILRHH